MSKASKGSEGKLGSFREALLNVQRGVGDDEIPVWENEIMPKDRWYIDHEEREAASFEREGTIPVIPVSEDELRDWSDPWKLTLVVNVMGKRLNYRVLENKINRDWARKGHVKIIDLPRGFYTVTFDEVDDYKRVLFDGPRMVADHYLLVQRWRQNFLKKAVTEKRVVVWIKIPELPLELYNLTFLTRLGSTLGHFLKMDQLTMIQARGQFSRICVELDLAKPLVPCVIIRGEKIMLEYEGLHSVCFNCGIYGHRLEVCPTMVVKT